MGATAVAKRLLGKKHMDLANWRKPGGMPLVHRHLCESSGLQSRKAEEGLGMRPHHHHHQPHRHQ